MEKKILFCTTLAAASNIVIWVPHYGGTAAVVNTLVPYIVLLLSLAIVGRAVKELVPGSQPELIAPCHKV